MSTKTYSLDFVGYWREPNIGGLPAKSGIYCVYACTHNVQEDMVSLKKLIYIGEAADIRDRVKNHERWSDWRRELGLGQKLCFNAALIEPQSDWKRAEAAMIFKHKPPCNVEYVDSFPFDETTVRTSGKNALLHREFTVYRTGTGAVMGLGLAGRRW